MSEWSESREVKKDKMPPICDIDGEIKFGRDAFPLVRSTDLVSNSHIRW